MDCTTFNLKLFTESEIKDLNVKSFEKTVKLYNPIRNAKFIEISNLFAKDTILFVECDLVDGDYSYYKHSGNRCIWKRKRISKSDSLYWIWRKYLRKR